MGIVRLGERAAVRLSTDAFERAEEPESSEARGAGRRDGVDRRRRVNVAQPVRPDARAP